MYSSAIIGTGSYLPPKILTNVEMEKFLDTTDEWIVSRTGIKQRHIAEDETTSDMGAKAARVALEQAQILPDEIDLIIVATTTPDLTFPSTAAFIQQKLGIDKEIPFFDVQAVCTGFIYAMTIADNFIRLGQAKNVLVIGAERMSKILDWKDRASCILFGDGAGAVVLQRKDYNFPNKILATKLEGNGNFNHILYTSGGPGSNAVTGYLQMNGKEVFKLAVEKMSENVFSLLKVNNIQLDEIDLFVPHQANLRIIESVGKKLSLSEEKIVITLDKHANTSAASIPLALDFHVRNNKASEELMVLAGIGPGVE
jgi:3-oxoacyl-[acyl-carrier-protein] synthase-3